MKLYYLTDLEGSLIRLFQFIELSQDISLHQGKIQLQPNCHFVFGGDIIDRGPDTLALCHLFNDLKKRQPDQFTIILGNRDLNKIRITTETAALENQELYQKMQHILSETMNAAHSLDFHNQEISEDCRLSEKIPLLWELFQNERALSRRNQIFTKKKINLVNTAQSYKSHLLPGGLIQEYLLNGQLAAIINDILIVHGAITDENFGFIPAEDAITSHPVEWVEKLNQWNQQQLQTWNHNPHDTSSGRELIRYISAHPITRSNQQSVVYGRYRRGVQSYLPSRKLLQHLKSHGIERSLAGHTPVGDSPLLLQGEGFQIAVCDPSYSDGFEQFAVVCDAEKMSFLSQQFKSFDWFKENSSPLGLVTVDGYAIKRPVGKQYYCYKIKEDFTEISELRYDVTNAETPHKH